MKQFIILFVAVLSLVGCSGNNTSTAIEAVPTVSSNNTPVTEVNSDTSDNQAYPVPSDMQSAYPVSAYPVEESKSPKSFFLDGISFGTSTVTGRGIPNTSIQIVSVTSMGEMLGSGNVEDSGTFEISLGRVVESSEKLGIQLSNVDAEAFGVMEGMSDIPMIGLLFDVKTASSE